MSFYETNYEKFDAMVENVLNKVFPGNKSIEYYDESEEQYFINEDDGISFYVDKIKIGNIEVSGFISWDEEYFTINVFIPNNADAEEKSKYLQIYENSPISKVWEYEDTDHSIMLVYDNKGANEDTIPQLMYEALSVLTKNATDINDLYFHEVKVKKLNFSALDYEWNYPSDKIVINGKFNDQLVLTKDGTLKLFMLGKEVSVNENELVAIGGKAPTLMKKGYINFAADNECYCLMGEVDGDEIPFSIDVSFKNKKEYECVCELLRQACQGTDISLTF